MRTAWCPVMGRCREKVTFTPQLDSFSLWQRLWLPCIKLGFPFRIIRMEMH